MTPVWRKSMDSVDFLDFYHGISGHLPWTQWTVWTMSMGTGQLVHGQSPVRPARLNNVDGFRGHYPWTQWTLSMDILDKVNNVHGLSPLSQWTDWTLSMDSLALSSLIWSIKKKMKLKGASLEIYIHTFLSKKFKLFELITFKQLIIHNI